MLLINEINHLTKDVNFSCGHGLTSFHSLPKAAALGSTGFHSTVRAQGTALVWEPRPELLGSSRRPKDCLGGKNTVHPPGWKGIYPGNPPRLVTDGHPACSSTFSGEELFSEPLTIPQLQVKPSLRSRKGAPAPWEIGPGTVVPPYLLEPSVFWEGGAALPAGSLGEFLVHRLSLLVQQREPLDLLRPTTLLLHSRAFTCR